MERDLWTCKPRPQGEGTYRTLDFNVGIFLFYENINGKWKICTDYALLKENEESVFAGIYFERKLAVRFDAACLG